MDRRDFLRALGAASACGMVPALAAGREPTFDALYRLPERGRCATIFHITDTHAQLLPVYYREPSLNVGVGAESGKPPHLTGDALLAHYGIEPGSRDCYAYSHVEFERLARRYGKMGGFAQLATLLKSLRAQRPGSMLVDGGDTWQGSATSLWTRGQDMVDAAVELGVDAMTGHWEFTYGTERVRELTASALHGKIEFLAQNVFTRDFGDRVFKPYVLREINGIVVAMIGQAYPYTPIANPQHLIPDWTFGIREESLQSLIAEVRANGAHAVVLLSHNGIDVDLKLARRISGLDAILGGHTHDALPSPIVVANSGGSTLVTNAGSNGKFLGVLDIMPNAARVRCEYRLLPVFSDLIAADPALSTLIDRVRAPYVKTLHEPLAVADRLLYRRGNFAGTFDELILAALAKETGCDIALSPGFRWGTCLLPGDPITVEDVMAQTAVTYPQVVVRDMTGAAIKETLEDVADNLFNPDPYYRQGGDMVRVGGLAFSCDPRERKDRRISRLRLGGTPLSAERKYRVANWAPVYEVERGEPVSELIMRHLRATDQS